MMARLFAAFDNAKKPLLFLPDSCDFIEPANCRKMNRCHSPFAKHAVPNSAAPAIGRFRAPAKNAETLAPNRLAPF
jgi:hypothetical protein